MLTPTSIRNAITRANELSYDYADLFIQDNGYGDSDQCCQLKLLILQRWAQILADYLRQHYDENDNIITPSFPCTTSAQIELVIGKINSVSCN